jgi:hypothetical protein
MTSQPRSVHPPAIAFGLISLFALGEQGESILGDLQEEFSIVAARSGARSARSWYRRQTIKTLPRLANFAFRTAPWRTLAAVVAGLLLRKLVAPLIGSATFAVLFRYEAFFEHHFRAYLFFASTGLDIEHLITFLLIGFIVAFAARGREIIATAMLAMIFAAMAVIGSTYAAIRSGDGALLWRLTWYFADSLAIVVAGAIVRTRRLATQSRHDTYRMSSRTN